MGLPVLSNKVDIANVRLEFENGCVANFTASAGSTERVRKLRFFQPHQYLSLDFARQDLLLIDVTAAAGCRMRELAALIETALEAGRLRAQRKHPTAGLKMSKVPVEAGEPLRLEIEAFLRAVRTRGQPVVTVADGQRALALALEINAAIASHATAARDCSRADGIVHVVGLADSRGDVADFELVGVERLVEGGFLLKVMVRVARRAGG